MKNDFSHNRPIGFSNKKERFLLPLIAGMEKLINDTQILYSHDFLKLDKRQRQALSILLIELAEDLHNDIGLWSSVEYFNNQLFNTPLPLFANSATEIKQLFDAARIKYFIHTIYFEFKPDLVIAPHHRDLDLLAKNVSEYMSVKSRTPPGFRA